jgi:hypothetical protein
VAVVGSGGRGRPPATPRRPGSRHPGRLRSSASRPRWSGPWTPLPRVRGHRPCKRRGRGESAGPARGGSVASCLGGAGCEGSSSCWSCLPSGAPPRGIRRRPPRRRPPLRGRRRPPFRSPPRRIPPRNRSRPSRRRTRCHPGVDGEVLRALKPLPPRSRGRRQADGDRGGAARGAGVRALARPVEAPLLRGRPVPVGTPRLDTVVPDPERGRTPRRGCASRTAESWTFIQGRAACRPLRRGPRRP